MENIHHIEKKLCTGCKLCKDVCPCGAISFFTDMEGFWYPRVNEEVCIKCRLCVIKCPALNYRGVSKYQQKVYAAWSLNQEIRINSTSGGLFYELASQILSESGFIAGCIYTKDYKAAVHIISNTRDDLNQIMGSKYFQSDTDGIYKAVLNLLKTNKKVLFCGTPCQVCALKRYVGDKYENLILVDFICRGINSPKAYKSYITELEERYHSTVKRVHLKNKRHGWTNLGTYIKFQNGREYYRNRYTDPWVNGFVNGNLFMRPACHNCQFRAIEHDSDITLGDYWGRKFSKPDMFYGVSLVLVNSSKGELLLTRANGGIYTEQHDIEDIISGNKSLVSSVKPDKKRTDFFERLDNEKFSSIVWDLLDMKSPKRQIRYYMLKIKQTVKNLIRSHG